jgi:hypothetical protein
MSHSHHAEPHVDHGGGNKRIAILISVIAALLAVIETAGKSAQTQYLSHQVEASNLWAFYQAKTIRRTVLIAAADRLQFDHDLNTAVPLNEGQAIDKRLAAWRADIDRWESEPSTGEGRRELTARAQEQETRRDLANHRYHNFEYGSAALQLAIVLASASIITGIGALAWAAIGLGSVGGVFGLLGWLAPTLLHL